MKSFISILQVTASILLVAVILMQSRGTGLSATFGGEGNVYRTKRGVEKIFFIATIILSAVFIGSSLAQLVLR